MNGVASISLCRRTSVVRLRFEAVGLHSLGVLFTFFLQNSFAAKCVMLQEMFLIGLLSFVTSVPPRAFTAKTASGKDVSRGQNHKNPKGEIVAARH